MVSKEKHRNVNIRIKKGEIVSLTGISGGGKSTLFLLLLGAYHPQSGSIHFVSEKGEVFPLEVKHAHCLPMFRREIYCSAEQYARI